MNPRYARYVLICALAGALAAPAHAAGGGSVWGNVLDGMKAGAAAIEKGEPIPTPPAAPAEASPAPGPVAGAAPAEVAEPARPLLVVNEGRRGPVRGTVPVSIDATSDKEMAFVLLRVGDHEDFISNVPSVNRQWDTRNYPDGLYSLVAESYAKHYLLRSAPVVVQIDNAGRIADVAPETPGTSALAPGVALPAPTPGSITVATPEQAQIISQKVTLQGGRAYVPLRPVMGAAGGRVSWQGKARTAGARRGERAAAVTIGSTTARQNGKPVPIDIPPYLRRSRTQIPARALGSLLGMAVEWVHDAKSVRLIVKPANP